MFEEFSRCVGRTPMIKLGPHLYAKLETFNPTGSVKDRIISFIVKRAIENGDIGNGTTLVEATSGNTGIALSAVGASLGLPVKIIMPCNMSEERRKMMKLYGAEIIDVPPSDFSRAIEIRNKLLLEGIDHWSPCQFENNDNVLCHELITAPEIYSDLQASGVKDWSAFVSGAGTGGTMMGVKNFVDSHHLSTKCVLLTPAEDAANHGIQGINDGQDFLLDPSTMDHICHISTKDAIERASRLSRENGLLVGISAGANVLAAERWIKSNNPKGAVVTLLCDRGERYMSIL